MSSQTKRIRVCFPFVGDSVGGSHISTLLLIEALDRNRFEPMVVVHEEGVLTEHLEARNIPFRLVALPVYAGEVAKLTSISFAIIRNLPRLMRFLRRNNVNIVHCNDFRTNLTWSPAAKLAGKRCIWHQRALPYSGSLLWRTIEILSDHVIFISRTVAHAIPSLRPGSSTIVTNPVDLARNGRSFRSAKEAFAHEFGIDLDAKIIGFVGGWSSGNDQTYSYAPLATWRSEHPLVI